MARVTIRILLMGGTGVDFSLSPKEDSDNAALSQDEYVRVCRADVLDQMENDNRLLVLGGAMYVKSNIMRIEVR